MDLFAGICVSDYGGMRPWYERLLGSPPAFEPHATECVWEIGEGRFIYIVENAERAGKSDLMLLTDDLDSVVEDIAARGIEPAKQETFSNGVRKATYRDADGNEVGFGAMPSDHPLG